MMKSKSYNDLMVFLFISIFCMSFLLQFYFYPIKYSPEIITYSQKYDLSPALISSIINTESRFDNQAVSSAGAIGLMQILPSTAEYISKKYNITFDNNLKNIKVNIEIGCAYVRYLLNKFSVTNTALAAYNAGETNVNSWLSDALYSLDGKTLINIPFPETAEYVKKVNKNFIRYLPFYKN